jgi:hypothetical protein
VFLASSRADELSWENHTLERSLFIDGLLHGLDRSSYPNAPVEVDFDTTLFDFVSRHVSIAAFHLSRAVQQPLRGGVVQFPLALPLLDSDPTTPRQTTFVALRRRLIRILATGGTAMVALTVLAFLLLYHTAVGDRGYIELRPGPSFLSPLADALGLPSLVETSLTMNSLPAESRDIHGVRTAVREKRISGLWTGSGSLNVRRWADAAIMEWVKEEERKRHLVQLGFPGAHAELRSVPLPGFPEPASGSELKLAEQAILLGGAGTTAPVVPNLLSALSVKQDCDAPRPSESAVKTVEYLLDFVPRREMVALSELLLNTANGKTELASFDLLRSGLGFLRVKSLVLADATGNPRLEQLKTAMRTPPPRGTAFDISLSSLRSLGRALAQQRLMRNQPPLAHDERDWLVERIAADVRNKPCGLQALIVLAAFRSEQDQPLLRKVIRSLDLSDPWARSWIASRASFARDLAAVEKLSDVEVSHLLDWHDYEVLFRQGEFRLRNEFVLMLRTILQHQKLPSAIAETLMATIEDEMARKSDFGRAIMEAMTSNAHHLEPDHRSRLIETVRKSLDRPPLGWEYRAARALWSRLAYSGALSASDLQALLPEPDELEAFRSIIFDEAAERASVTELRAGPDTLDAVVFARTLEGLHKAAVPLVRTWP